MSLWDRPVMSAEYRLPLLAKTNAPCSAVSRDSWATCSLLWMLDMTRCLGPFMIAFAEVYMQTAAVADVHYFSAAFHFFCSLRKTLFCFITASWLFTDLWIWAKLVATLKLKASKLCSLQRCIMKLVYCIFSFRRPCLSKRRLWNVDDCRYGRVVYICTTIMSCGNSTDECPIRPTRTAV